MGKAHGSERGKDRDQFYIGDKSKDNKLIATVHYCLTIEETTANARLIAAAPDLLEAAKDVLNLFSECAHCRGTGLEVPEGTVKDACSVCGGLGKTCNATALYSDLVEAINKAEGNNES